MDINDELQEKPPGLKIQGRYMRNIGEFRFIKPYLSGTVSEQKLSGSRIEFHKGYTQALVSHTANRARAWAPQLSAGP